MPRDDVRYSRPTPAAALAAVLALAWLTGCSTAVPSGGSPPSGATTIRLYTSVTQDTVDAVLAAFAEEHPEIRVETYRAPTGEIDARIAAERRSGGIAADLLWGTDPLSMEQYDADGLLRAWVPSNAGAVPDGYREPTFTGTRILNLVIVAAADLAAAPADWSDLADPTLRGGVALADPGFAGSAFGGMAYFALAPEYGVDYLQALAGNGATQVQSIGDVINGVAEGQFRAGISLDKSVRDAIDAGSPLQLIWPASGAVALYSPIAVFASAAHPAAAETFADFVLGIEAQSAIAATGWQPVRNDVPWELTGGLQLQPDWHAAFAQRDELLARYRSIFGG